MSRNIAFKPPILVSEKAADKFFDFISTKREERQVFTIGVLENRGCSGNKYYIKPFDLNSVNAKLFDFFVYDKKSGEYKKYSEDEDDNDNDAIIFAIDRFSLFKLIGSTIDFSDEDRLSKGFFFTNPNETGRCGCGASFST